MITNNQSFSSDKDKLEIIVNQRDGVLLHLIAPFMASVL